MAQSQYQQAADNAFANLDKSGLSVVNLQGKVVHQRGVVGTGVEQTERLELDKASSGLYLIRLEGKQSGVRTGKLVLER